MTQTAVLGMGPKRPTVKRLLGKLQGGHYWAHYELIDQLIGALRLPGNLRDTARLLVGYSKRPRPVEVTIGRIMLDTGCCARQVNRYLDGLAERELIEIDRQHGRAPVIDVSPLLDKLESMADALRNSLAWLHDLCRKIGSGIFGSQPRDISDVVWRAQEAQRLAGWSNGELGDAIERSARQTAERPRRSVWGYLLTILKIEAQSTAERKAEQEADERKLKEVYRAPAASETREEEAAAPADEREPEVESYQEVGTSEQPANGCNSDEPAPAAGAGMVADVAGSAPEETITPDSPACIREAFLQFHERGRWPMVYVRADRQGWAVTPSWGGPFGWKAFAEKGTEAEHYQALQKLYQRLGELKPLAAAGGD